MNSNTLEFFVKMKDLMSSGLAKIAQTSKDTFKKVQGNIDATKKRNDLLGQSYDMITDRMRKVEDAIRSSQSVSHIRTLRRELEGLQMMQSRAPGNIGGGNIAGKIGGYLGRMIGTAAVGLLGIGAAGSFVNSSIDKAIGFEATNKSFEVLTGNKAKGQGLAGDLNKLQRDTILGPEVFKSAQTLLGFGITADKVIPTLKMLGDVSMGDKEKLNSLTLAFAQTSSAGKLTGQDLLQYVNAGFNPLSEIAKMTGKSIGDLRQEMEKGGITSDMVVKAFQAATGAGGKFNNMMEQMAETTMGKLAIADGQTEADMIAIGERMKPLREGWTKLKLAVLDMLTPQARLQDSVISEKFAINTLVGSITSANVANDVRRSMIEKLKKSYPDLFSSINTETVKNTELLDILKNVNQQYEKRIELATLQQKVNDLSAQSQELFNMRVQQSIVNSQSQTNPEKLWNFVYNAFSSKQLDELQSRNAENLAFTQGALQTASVQGRIQSVLDFAKDPSKMKGFAGRDGDKALFLQTIDIFNKRGFSGVSGMKTLQMMESLMNGSVSAAGIATPTGTEKDTKGGSLAAGITGGGPRTININGVTMKVADKMELHASSVDEFIDNMEPKFRDMFLRILNSGAAMQ